ncbi:MAG: DUF2092 domain-containing protein [Nitrosomonas sp.]|nr:DUF2092 domain-containing protein [Nitrosomonas sp.]
MIDGVPAHHLAGRTETVDYQIWIPDGAKPLLLDRADLQKFRRTASLPVRVFRVVPDT